MVPLEFHFLRGIDGSRTRSVPTAFFIRFIVVREALVATGTQTEITKHEKWSARARDVRAKLDNRSVWLSRVLSLVFSALALGGVYLFVRKTADTAWPLAGANLRLVGVAAGLFLLSYLFRALGWRRLFVPSERPDRSAMLAASGGGIVTSAVLPGRLDLLVKVAILRGFKRKLGFNAIAISLATLALLDAVILLPLATTGAVTSSTPAVRASLAVIALVGLIAAIAFIATSRLLRWTTNSKWPPLRRFGTRAAARIVSVRETALAYVSLSLSWYARAAGLLLLLAAMDIGFSPALALSFLCLTAGAAIIPIAPAGAAVQVGAGAAILIAFNVSVEQAANFALVLNLLLLTAGLAGALFATVWWGRRRALGLVRA